MEFKDLQVFQMVAEKGTVTSAAKELSYVQSNVTSRIQKLEAKLNTQLFHRHNRGMSLTPEGKKLLLYSEKILALTNQAKKVIQNSKEPYGKLEIGSVETVIKLPTILSIYNKKYKNVDLSLFTGVTKQLQEDVLNHRLDGAFITKVDHHPDLVQYDVFQEELVLISDKTPTTIEELANKSFLCFSQGCGYRAKLEEWFNDKKVTPKMMEFGTLETILGSVVAGLGITFVPKSSVVYLERKGLIQCHYLPDKYSEINTVFIRRADSYLTSSVEKFIETIDYCKGETLYPLAF